MPDLPPDAIRVVLAAVLPCERCGGIGRRYDLPWPIRCGRCGGTGTRIVVTDIEVERFGMVWDHSPNPMSLPWLWRKGGSPLGPNETHVWREVPRG